MRRTGSKAIPPLVVPPGVRLVLAVGGQEYAVRLVSRLPRTAAGECPRRVTPRTASADGGLFDAVAAAPAVAPEPAAVIRVYAAKYDLDRAYAVANHPDLRPYPTEVRTEPEDGSPRC